MDRQIVYPGSIPLDTDLLNIQRNVMAGLGGLAQCMLGSSVVADGLPCAPWASGYGVSIGPGSLTRAAPMDGTPFGSLPADPTGIVKTGLNRGWTDLPLPPGPTKDVVVCWLVQAVLVEQDGGPVALPYWNAADPTVPFSGPGNSGAAQNTQRQTRVALLAKPSAPLPLGTYAPPAVDAGWVGLYGVTAWSGKAQIDAGDVRLLADAPFLPFRLPQLTPGFSRQELFRATTSWQVPAGVRRLRVRLVGGGGGGGGGGGSFGGGGGGAGGYAESILTVLPGATFTLTIGAGGNAGGPGESGGAGGATSFAALVAATGGGGGASSNPDCHGGAGGTGTVGGLLQAGGYGGDGPSIAGVPAGGGGSSAFGGGGRGAYLGGVQTNGTAAGSGAGGGYGAPSAGGLGAGGLIIIEY